MASQQELQSRLESLELAISTGALEVEHNGKRVKYRDLEKMRMIADDLRKELGIVPRRANRTYIVATRR